VPVARRSAVPNRPGLRDDDFDGNASTVTPSTRARPALEQRDDYGSDCECVEDRLGVIRAADDREVERGVGPAARIAGDLTAELVGDLLEQRTRAVERHALLLRPLGVFESLQQAPFGLRPDSGDGCQPAVARSLAKLLGSRDAERAADLDHALRSHAEEASEPDQLGLHLALELVELGDAARLDELAQSSRDPRADPAQLLDAAGRDELGDRRLRLADRLGRAAVRARRVVAAARQVKQARERLELLGDVRIVTPLVLPHGDVRDPYRVNGKTRLGDRQLARRCSRTCRTLPARRSSSTRRRPGSRSPRRCRPRRPVTIVNSDVPCVTPPSSSELTAAAPRSSPPTTGRRTRSRSATRATSSRSTATAAPRASSAARRDALDLPGLRDDVDTWDDLERVRAASAKHTRAYLG
jgi:hypothetical protein